MKHNTSVKPTSANRVLTFRRFPLMHAKWSGVSPFSFFCRDTPIRSSSKKKKSCFLTFHMQMNMDMSICPFNEDHYFFLTTSANPLAPPPPPHTPHEPNYLSIELISLSGTVTVGPYHRAAVTIMLVNKTTQLTLKVLHWRILVELIVCLRTGWTVSSSDLSGERKVCYYTWPNWSQRRHGIYIHEQTNYFLKSPNLQNTHTHSQTTNKNTKQRQKTTHK